MSRRPEFKNLAVPALVFTLLLSACGFSEQMLDISDCVIVTAGKANKLEAKYVTVLKEEIAKRTGAEPKVSDEWPGGTSVIAVGVRSDLKQSTGPCYKDYQNQQKGHAEGFAIYARTEPVNSVVIIGEDERGMLYGIGWFLRKAQIRAGSIKVPANLKKVSAPAYPLRGHQLGYRPKPNAYDAWTVETFDQYIRELALFGSNAIELLPPMTASSNFKNELMLYEPLDLMVKLTEIIDSYGLDVWIWYPNMGHDDDVRDFTDEKLMARQLKERDEVFKAIKRLDHILVPGGDPGDLHPDQLFPWLEHIAPVMNKYHPNAKIWVSPQHLRPTREWMASFYKQVNKKPDWLGGAVFAPWSKTPIEKMRQIVDKDLPIRRYPDITHNIACQYPVRDWDLAFALTLHREPYNPRPVAMKVIHNRFARAACGSITYSEGINDDINKFIWGDQDWDPQRSVLETLRDYSRLFISPDMDDELAHGFVAYERNWQGPLLANNQVDVTFLQWRQMEKEASEQVKNNYRFQMGLMRAYYDKYIRRRLFYETELEMEAMDILRNAGQSGSLAAIDKAKKKLAESDEKRVARDLWTKCDYLADELFKNIGYQTYVGKHKAIHRTRGASMDGIDEPLNNRRWLYTRFAEISKLTDEQARLDAVEKIVNRINPGPGGFYDDMGTLPSFERIENTVAWEDDPGTLLSPRISFYYKLNQDSDRNFPLPFKSQVSTVYETPLTLSWDDLDPTAQYRIRVAYTGKHGKKIRCVANDVYKVHDFVEALEPPVREFNVPKEATTGGRLELTWDCGDGEWSSQVAEIWLMKK